jgi:hypothetical protein
MPSLRTRLKMDRGLCLVVQARPGVRALYSIPVRHPVPSRYPAAAGRLPSEAPSLAPRCTTATPFASIRLGLRLAKYVNILYIWLTFKNMCRARHTQSIKRKGQQGHSGFEHLGGVNNRNHKPSQWKPWLPLASDVIALIQKRTYA